MTDEEVLDNLKDQKVTQVRRFTRKINNEIIPTNSFLLRIAATRVPYVIRLGPHQVILLTYYPKLMLCLNWAHYGHTRLRCKTSQICHNCGIPAQGEYTYPLKCDNCKGNYNSFDII